MHQFISLHKWGYLCEISILVSVATNEDNGRNEINTKQRWRVELQIVSGHYELISWSGSSISKEFSGLGFESYSG